MANITTRILIVDDEKVALRMLQAHLLRQGHEVVTATEGHEALSILEDHQVELVISDLVMPGMDGLKFMQAAKKRNPNVHFIFHTARGSIESAVEAIRLGALDYLEKPFHAKTFDVVLQRALVYARLSHENTELREHFRQRFSFHNIVTQSPVMQQTLELASQVAASPRTTVSLIGESGVGKEVLARAIHFESGCMPTSFVAVNCASIPESLLESELFGHVKGAFTGAERERDGKVTMARNGTLLLDEIGDMPLSLQTKLLRVLEERSYEKVGSNTSIPVECRIMVATHRNLIDMVQQNLFREDLFHRINVVPISVPPLRERKEDIPLLVDFFLDLFRQHQGKPLPGISQKAMNEIMTHSWPGNVRELRNVLEYASIVTSDELIRPEHLRLSAPGQAEGSQESGKVEFRVALDPDEVSLEAITSKVLEISLSRFDGNKSKAAAFLKVNRKIFYR